MSGRAAPLADLHRELDWLALELSSASDLDGTSPDYFRGRLMLIIAALGGVVTAAITALEPAKMEETHRADARDRFAGGLDRCA